MHRTRRSSLIFFFLSMSRRFSSTSKKCVSTNSSAVASAGTPSIQEIVSCTSIEKVAGWCKHEGLDDDGKESLTEVKIQLLQHRGKLLSLTTLPPPVS